MRPGFRWRIAYLVLAIDLVGTSLFAAEGATTAILAHLDLLGVLVLAFVTAVGGGLVRDVLLGETPPSSIRDWRYAAIAFATAALIFWSHASLFMMPDRWLIALDAAGLSFFAVSGVTKALEYKLHPLPAIMMGGITGVGGGTLRDLLINRIPSVLVSDIYASAALLGSLVTVLLIRLGLRPALASMCGIAACFTLRMVAVHRGWSLPGVRH